MAMDYLGHSRTISRELEAPSEWAALSAPLREYGEISAQRLSAALADALHQAQQQLFSASTQALSRADSEAMLEAAEFARSRKQALIQDFLRHFERRYARACNYKPAALSSYRIDFDASQLEIVQHDLLDDSLEPGQLAEAIQNAGWCGLNDLTQAFAQCLNAGALKPSDMPLNPRLIEAAVSEALRGQMGRHEAKLRLMMSLKRFLPGRISALFQDLAERMRSRNRQHEASASVIEVPACTPEPALHGRPPPSLVRDRVASPDHAVADRNGVEPALSKSVAVDDCPSLPPGTPVAGASRVDRPICPAAPKAARSMPGPASANLAGMRAPTAMSVEPKPALPRKSEVQQIKPAVNSDSRTALPLARLEAGVWLEYRSAEGVWTALKVAWISPRKNLYLLTNRKGERALSMLAKDLAAALMDGRARLILPCDQSASARFVPEGQVKKTA